MKTSNHLYHFNQNFQLESGSTLPGFQLKYTTLGKPNADKSNVIWVCHALTGSSDFMDWWGDLFSEGGPFSPIDYFIICANTLGGCYGSTGPLTNAPILGKPFYHDFPIITNNDIVRAFDLLRVHLGFEKIHTLIGGSLGGQQVLSWAVYQPGVFENLIPMACNAIHSPWGIAINEAQRMAIEADSTWQNQEANAGKIGLKAARAASMITFRTVEAFSNQTNNDQDQLDSYSASSYQQYQGQKLADRFDAFSYWTLTKAMDNHHVGRGHGNLVTALQKITASTLVIGIDSDLLFPVAEQKLITELVPNAKLKIIQSKYGHDGFLIETEKIKTIIQQFFKKQNKFILQ